MFTPLQVLSDDEKRQIYDLEGLEGLERHEKGGAGGGPMSPFDMFFGGGGQGGRRKGPDAQVRDPLVHRRFWACIPVATVQLRCLTSSVAY